MKKILLLALLLGGCSTQAIVQKPAHPEWTVQYNTITKEYALDHWNPWVVVERWDHLKSLSEVDSVVALTYRIREERNALRKEEQGISGAWVDVPYEVKR